MKNNKIFENANLGLTFDDVLLIPNYSDVIRSTICTESEIIKGYKTNLPFISSPMDTISGPKMVGLMYDSGAFGILHSNMNKNQTLQCIKKFVDININFAVSIGPDEDEKLKLFIDKGLKIICLDNAHADSKRVYDSLARYKKISEKVIVGNIVTAHATKNLIDNGADAIKVGIGSGSICTTRVTTGFGYPQLSAIYNCANVANKYSVPIIADGGIRNSSDIAKAIAVGASSVMLGNILAGTVETPGSVIKNKNGLFKTYRGMGSNEAMKQGSHKRYNLGDSYLNSSNSVPEGVSAFMPHKGSAKQLLFNLGEYLKNSLYYAGAHDLNNFRENIQLVQITNAGVIESNIHNVITKL